MNRLYHIIFCLGFLLLVTSAASGQYNMQNAMVTDCEGVLIDSENGPGDGQYDHEEDFLFTICVEGASEITVVFDFFATEATFDVLTIYDGPDATSPVIASLDGVLSNPPVLVATSGCISFHFVSDANIVALGWSLSWSVEIDDIADPDLIVESELDCPLGELELSIDPRVPCEVLSPENFQLIGPGSSTVSEVIALDCDNEGTSSSFNLVMNDSLSLVGIYTVVFSAYIINSCGDTLTFESLVSFELENCPFQVEILVVEAACSGECGQVGVEIYSTDPGPYAISWSHTIDANETVEVCADAVFMIDVFVENLSNGVSAQDQYSYTPLPLPQILNPFLSDTICSSSGNHNLSVDISGGHWDSRIMDNGNGNYESWRWRNHDGIQEDVITYTDPNGCVTMDTVYISPVNAGPDQAACLGQGEMILTGSNPNDGSWSGPFTSTDGVFTVSTPGVYSVFYTNPYGCTNEKIVDVVDELEIIDIDTLCSNTEIELINNVNSAGGQWTGAGIVNPYYGRLQAWKANINEWNTFYYDIEGCRDSIEIYIQGIWAGPDLSVCTETEFIQLLFHGTWTGPGIYNPIDSTYDISGLAPGTYNIRGRKANCEDRMELTIHDVRVDYIGEEIYCYDAGLISIEEIVSSTPNNGDYAGLAVVNMSDEIFLDPSLVLGTESYVVFEALGCKDSVLVKIEQALDLQDYEFCVFDDLQTLDNNGNEGYWEGTGILVPETGLINIEDLNLGFNEVHFVSDLSCRTPVVIEIVGLIEAEINNILDTYCFQDSNYIIDLVPGDGIFTINGNEVPPVLNPAELGPGFHELKYIVGTGECEDRTTTYVVVSEPISGFTYALRDTLCPNESTTVFVESEGGYNVVSGFWDQGLGFGKSHIIWPGATTQYSVTLTDGCSEELQLDLEVVVIDSFNVDFKYGPQVCFGDSSYIEISVDQPENFDLTWDGSLDSDDLIYTNLPGEYQLNILENATGCEQDYWLEVPGSDPIVAGFSLIPNQECIDILNNEISVLNLAQGYTSGYMNFGQGDSDIDLDFGDLSTSYNDIGEYTITQVVTNDLGCVDSISRKICIDNLVLFYVPNIFSPDGDGINDLYTITALGIENYEMSIFNRWGNLIFSSTNVDNAWDGTYQGELVESGVYPVIIQYKDQETGEVFQECHGVTLLR